MSGGLIEVTSNGERYAINPNQVKYISLDGDGTSYVSFGERHGLTLNIPYAELITRLNDWMRREPDIVPIGLPAAE
ncbi:hypothetical protein BA190_08925 [Labrys sp. WJW]|uniref:hypothetical protein n=1 Tax=Labrys sp. WJW TaxID=1737983 RepID=UPI0008349C8C|nr:hypothetical protein [Labrys sp. WJW]OCC05515.1 hypothetical protein BA190_08925 [Labrys sp. WJW]